MNPPHNGHGKVFEQALSLKDSTTDVKLFLSSSFDAYKNPLPRDVRQYFISSFFPYIKDSIQDVNIKNLFEITESLNGEYDDIVLVCGSDRADGFKKTLDKYNGSLYNFNSIEILLAGEDRAGCMYSSTLMRESVKNDDFQTFKLCLPGDDEYLKYNMFLDVQTYMGK